MKKDDLGVPPISGNSHMYTYIYIYIQPHFHTTLKAYSTNEQRMPHCGCQWPLSTSLSPGESIGLEIMFPKYVLYMVNNSSQILYIILILGLRMIL